MFLPPEEVAACEARYGVPRVVAIEAPLTPAEMDRLVASQRHGRAHDITLFILDGEGADRRVVVIRKQQFPPGCWRPPSGGVDPGEPMEAGALREAREETGLHVALTRYLVRVEARFIELSADAPSESRQGAERGGAARSLAQGDPSGLIAPGGSVRASEPADPASPGDRAAPAGIGQGRVVPWTSHVFAARRLGGALAPLDTEEIAEARWATLGELAGPIRAALLASGSGGLRYRARLHDATLAALGP